MKTSPHAALDNIARTLAGATSRRTALKMTMATLGGAALSRFGIDNAWAASNCLCNDRVYDSALACCTPAGIVQKHPIARLADCPARTANLSHTCTPNGCGAAGSWVAPPQSYFGVSFVPACDTHDCCYDKCNQVKALCDTNFYDDLSAICNAAFAGTGTIQRIKRGGCLKQAETYYNAVAAYGQDAYDSAQKLSCDCCPPDNCRTCAGGVCGAFPTCVGGGDCVCFTAPDGSGACIHGNTPCAGLPTCTSHDDCPPGYGCAGTNCCGGVALCGPLCSDLTPSPLISPFAGAQHYNGPTLGGKR
ncbi:hypothetical protein [Duganella sp.]|uniref:hypothetical protein n=1 Tax=Duganella sp. TaxID=1904440 RepID=UPI0031E261D6